MAATSIGTLSRMRRRGLLVLAGGLLTALLAVGVVKAPVPWVVLQPGPTVDTLGTNEGEQVIRIEDAPVSTSTGQLRLTTINVDTDVTLRQAFASWWDDSQAVAPREAIFPPGETTDQVQQHNAADFQESQTSAQTAAEHELGHPIKVTLKLDKIGGPSAGLMFALGIIDKARAEDLTGGRVIAGTGTIDDAGAVGPIGGIPQKLRGAKAAGATYFLVPADNCAEATRNAVPGLPMARVSTLPEALTALRAIAAGNAPTPCS
jgi:PDZ domain-containing protein